MTNMSQYISTNRKMRIIGIRIYFIVKSQWICHIVVFLADIMAVPPNTQSLPKSRGLSLFDRQAQLHAHDHDRGPDYLSTTIFDASTTHMTPVDSVLSTIDSTLPVRQSSPPLSSGCKNISEPACLRGAVSVRTCPVDPVPLLWMPFSASRWRYVEGGGSGALGVIEDEEGVGIEMC